MAYSTDQDLENRRAGILALLPDGGHPHRVLAEEQLLDDLERRWYRPTAQTRGLDWRTRPMDPDRFAPDELRRLSILKTLACVHEFLMKYGKLEADGFERHRDLYEREYRNELRLLVEAGPAYTWESGEPEPGVRSARTLERA